MNRAKTIKKFASGDPVGVNNSKAKRPWYLTLFNLLLLILLVYLGRQTLQQFRNAGLERGATAATIPVFTGTIPAAEAAVRPLIDYRSIWGRNLFNLSKEMPPAPKKEISPDKLALAQKDIGLKLVGTVVADNPFLSRAFIDSRSAREQIAYREGDQAGRVIIKKIMRNKVIIGTDRGDKLLTVEIEETLQASISHLSQQPAVANAYTAPQTSANPLPRARTRSISLDREEVETTLADTDQILHELKISPYMIGDRPSGFRLGNIKADSVLAKMGLRNGVVITEVNGEAITGPDQAAMFFQTLKEGGDIAIKFRRRRRTMQINLNIG